MSKVIKREQLKEMPFDRFNSEDGFIHSTGYRCYFDDGSCELEQENCIFEDAENCVYTVEDDEEDVFEDDIENNVLIDIE